MNLMIGQRRNGAVTVLYLSGRIVLGEESTRLLETLTDLAAGGEKKILLNLAEVTYLDSAGLGALVRSQAAVAKQDGQLKLLHVPAKVQTLLRITKLQHLFEMFDDEASAVASFG
ncbi:MAG: anti-sigma-factor antagonist [Acidobacteria bacterium]|nr:anti-sigma-factor antagonist [Acidobacteriota bacterium]